MLHKVRYAGLMANNPLSPPRMMLSTTSLKKQIPSSQSEKYGWD